MHGCTRQGACWLRWRVRQFDVSRRFVTAENTLVHLEAAMGCQCQENWYRTTESVPLRLELGPAYADVSAFPRRKSAHFAVNQ